MAYIIGLLTTEEEAELKQRGWEIEMAPAVDFDTGRTWRGPHRMRMVWVDQDMFQVMDGPDWDKSHAEGPDQNDEGRTGDASFERWWNGLTRNERTRMFTHLRLQSWEQVELFCGRLWHELHAWMRDDLRPLCQELEVAIGGNQSASNTAG